MLTILNANDRNRAFLKFAIMFVVTVTLIICAAYVDFRGLPAARQNYLEQNYDLNRTQFLNQESFVRHMQRANLLLDSLSKNPNRADQIEPYLTATVQDLAETRQKDSSVFGSLDSQVFNSIIKLGELERQNRELRKMASQAESYKSERDQLNILLDNYRARPQTSGF